MLLERGANADASCTSGSTPLHVAASLGHDRVVEVLLGWGANPDAVDVSTGTLFRISLFTLVKHTRTLDDGIQSMQSQNKTF